MKKLTVSTLALLVSIFVLGALSFNRNANAAALAIGSTVENFSLPDSNGVEKSLSSLKGAKGTVIVFYSTRCPWVAAYAERLDRIAKDYKPKGINVIGINSNSTEPEEEVKTKSASLSFPMLIDKGNKIADMFGAERTPEVYFLNSNNVLVYHGAVDNNKDVSMANKPFLRDAIDATLASKAIEKADVPAVGCTIKKVAKQ
jgi:peroxiredoxin